MPRALSRALALLLVANACSAEPAQTPAQPTAPAPAAAAGETPAPTPACNIPECFRAVECVAKCGTPVLSSSCCECPEGQLDQLVACPPPHVPVCDPGCTTVCENGLCNCECTDPQNADPAQSSEAPATL